MEENREMEMITEENKSEVDLLKELILLQKKTANRQLVASIACVVLPVIFTVAFLIVVPRVITMSAEVNSMVADTQKLIANAQSSLEGIDGMIENVNKVVVDNTQSLTDAVSNIQNIDTDGLNEAIKNLSDAAEPLAKLNNQVTNLFSNGLFSRGN